MLGTLQKEEKEGRNNPNKKKGIETFTNQLMELYGCD
jgi:hypothetical protein